MILTNKILILFIAAIIISIIGFIYFTLDGDMVVPNPRIEGDIVRNINIEDFDEIDIRGNQWKVNIIRADTFGIIIEGPDNLLNNYLSITKEKNKLLFNVSPEIKESYYHLKLKICLPSLKKLFADNSNCPIILINSRTGRVRRNYGSIRINMNNLNEDDFIIKISGQTTVDMDSCQINNLYADANNISQIYISKSDIMNLEYIFAGVSMMVAESVEGNCNGTLSDFSVIDIKDKRQNRKVFYSDDYFSSINSLGEVLSGLQWGSSQKKVKDYFINKDAIIDSVFILPTYGVSNIYFKDCKFMGINIESISALFNNDILVHLSFGFHDSVSTDKIDSWLTNNFGDYNSKRKKSKRWRINNKEGKHITDLEFINITEKMVTFQSIEWFEIQKNMYTSEMEILDETISF